MVSSVQAVPGFFVYDKEGQESSNELAVSICIFGRVDLFFLRRAYSLGGSRICGCRADPLGGYFCVCLGSSKDGVDR